MFAALGFLSLSITHVSASKVQCSAGQQCHGAVSASVLQTRSHEFHGPPPPPPASSALCPSNYPICDKTVKGLSDCTISGASKPWKKAPTVDTPPVISYNYIGGYDGNGTNCQGNFSGRCPSNYPICHTLKNKSDCTISGASGSWKKAPTVDTPPGNTYNYISGYDGLGTQCQGDFEAQAASALCPSNYPICDTLKNKSDCTISGASGSWKKAPTADTPPVITYNYIRGYDGNGTHCEGDFQAPTETRGSSVL